MLDMIRKHTVEGTGNHRSICAMLDRTRESIFQTKETNRNFVPPAGMRDSIPIGSSSASMYPGYSPADIIYGEPAREFGAQWTEAQKSGVELSSGDDGPQYEVGQSKGQKKEKKTIAQIRAEHAAKETAAAQASQHSLPTLKPKPLTTEDLPASRTFQAYQPLQALRPKPPTGGDGLSSTFKADSSLANPKSQTATRKGRPKSPSEHHVDRPLQPLQPKPATNGVAPSGPADTTFVANLEGKGLAGSDSNPTFVIDVNPTPIDLRSKTVPSKEVDQQSGELQARPSKKRKRKAGDEDAVELDETAKPAKEKKAKKSKEDRESKEAQESSKSKTSNRGQKADEPAVHPERMNQVPSAAIADQFDKPKPAAIVEEGKKQEKKGRKSKQPKKDVAKLGDGRQGEADAQLQGELTETVEPVKVAGSKKNKKSKKAKEES